MKLSRRIQIEANLSAAEVHAFILGILDWGAGVQNKKAGKNIKPSYDLRLIEAYSAGRQTAEKTHSDNMDKTIHASNLVRGSIVK